jgi:hypothetical protein
MIGFFTDPHPDELLYSSCARYHQRARTQSKEATALDLFGNTRSKFIVDFPARLTYLVSQLPPETYSTARLIEENTMLPYYAPFMPPERHEILRSDMCSEGGGSIHARLGILTSGIRVEHLRFCPNCIEADRLLYGEPYWHRVHQAPGIEVCPTHEVFLSDSKVSVRNRGNTRALVTARQAVDEIPPSNRVTRPLDPENPEHRVLLRLARDAKWILDTQIEAPGQEALRRRYLSLLFEQGIASYSGQVKHARLKTRFLDYYPSGLLDRLGCGLDLKYHWLRRLVNEWRGVRHPLHHLLLMQFLNVSAQEFFRLPDKAEPFGKGPWPCLNAAEEHFHDRRIAECQVSHKRDASKRLIGTFMCECGFSYKRFGPDLTNERRYEYDRIMSFGDVWYEKLRDMIALGNNSFLEIARVFSVSVNTVNKESQRLKKSDELGLPLTRRFDRHRKVAPKSIDLELQNRHRNTWTKIAINNPKAGRYALSRIERKSYEWLLKHDKAWLDSNSPARLKRSGTVQRIDWSERDTKFATAIRETAEKILTAPSRPVWASRTGIPKELGILTVLRKNPSKLPLTNKALDDVSESQVAFAVRRIRWAADCYCQEQVLAAWWNLQTRAAVSNKMGCVPEVKAAVNECVRKLREMNEAGWESPAKGSV